MINQVVKSSENTSKNSKHVVQTRGKAVNSARGTRELKADENCDIVESESLAGSEEEVILQVNEAGFESEEEIKVVMEEAASQEHAEEEGKDDNVVSETATGKRMFAYEDLEKLLLQDHSFLKKIEMKISEMKGEQTSGNNENEAQNNVSNNATRPVPLRSDFRGVNNQVTAECNPKKRCGLGGQQPPRKSKEFSVQSPSNTTIYTGLVSTDSSPENENPGIHSLNTSSDTTDYGSEDSVNVDVDHINDTLKLNVISDGQKPTNEGTDQPSTSKGQRGNEQQTLSTETIRKCM